MSRPGSSYRTAILQGAAVGLGLQAGKRVKAAFKQSARKTFTPPLDVKAFDIGFSNSNFTVAGTFTPLNVPINGAEQYQRVGRRITLRSLSIKGFVNFGATTVQDLARIIVVYDAQPNAALPVLADILQNSNAGLATTNLSFHNLNNRDRFIFLKDYKVMLPAVTVAAGVLTNEAIPDPIYHTFNIDWEIPLRRMETTFNAVNGGTIADVTTGSLLLVTLDGNNAGTVSFAFSSRVRYID